MPLLLDEVLCPTLTALILLPVLWGEDPESTVILVCDLLFVVALRLFFLFLFVVFFFHGLL
jgi:hypothetical protein